MCRSFLLLLTITQLSLGSKSSVRSIKLGNGTVLEFNIVGGINADVADFPFYAMLVTQFSALATQRTGVELKLHCGSSLIHPRFLITAFHCFKHSHSPKEWVAVFKVTDRCQPPPDVVFRELRTVHYLNDSASTPYLKRHDIVVVELQVPIDDITPAFLPSYPPIVGVKGIIIGFGRMEWVKYDRYDSIPCTLRMTAERVEEFSKCKRRVTAAHGGKVSKIVVGAFCGVQSSTTACRGDSGGPWLTPVAHGYEVQGMSSFGSFNCRAEVNSDFYVDVYHYVPWIKSVIHKRSGASPYPGGFGQLGRRRLADFFRIENSASEKQAQQEEQNEK